MICQKTEQTIAAYNKNGETYAAKFDNYQTYIQKITDFQIKHVPPGAKILDLGCGPGNNIYVLSQQDNTCRFTGVDLSSSFLEMAQKRHPNAVFLQQDIRTPYTFSDFDTVIASFCIVHMEKLEDVAQFINNTADYLKKGGTLYLSFMEGKEAGFETTSFSQDELFFNYFPRQQVIELLEHHQLSILEISTEPYEEANGTITSDIFIYAEK